MIDMSCMTLRIDHSRIVDLPMVISALVPCMRTNVSMSCLHNDLHDYQFACVCMDTDCMYTNTC